MTQIDRAVETARQAHAGCDSLIEASHDNEEIILVYRKILKGVIIPPKSFCGIPARVEWR